MAFVETLRVHTTACLLDLQLYGQPDAAIKVPRAIVTECNAMCWVAKLRAACCVLLSSPIVFAPVLCMLIECSLVLLQV